MSDNKEKFIRTMTFHLYKNQVHEQTQTSSIYKINGLTGKEGVDPFKSCKTLKEIKEIFLTEQRELVSKIFDEGVDFILAKTNKRGLCVFQQIFPHEINNSVRFIKEVD